MSDGRKLASMKLFAVGGRARILIPGLIASNVADFAHDLSAAASLI
jgi:hypothetical protein